MRRIPGLLLAFAGAIILSLLAALMYLHPRGYEQVLFALGIPLSLLLACVAQVAVLVGLWLVWRPGRSPDKAPPAGGWGHDAARPR